uniref:hypothetical protein n=1 Tax=Bacteroidota TaxID=976 RepID=UPI0040477070
MEKLKLTSLIIIQVLLILITVSVGLQAYWTYIANEEKIENFHDSEFRKEKEQQDRIKELEKKIQEMEF